MKKKIYSYVKEHPSCSLFDIEADLDLHGTEVMRMLRELRKDAYIRIEVYPVKPNQQTSHFYTATGKPFVDSQAEN